MKEFILIGDNRVKAISVKECDEPIVNLAIEFPQLSFDEDRLYVQKKSESISYARRSVGQKLLEAQSLLPHGMRLLIKEGYRPMWVQKGFWENYSAYIRKTFPNWTEEEVYNECSKLNAPIDVAPHTTGGAIDLTLIDGNGEWLDMGTEFNASPLDTQNATFTEAQNISDQAKKNRRILVNVMASVGFINYPTEWWHWSYGDKYWALMTGNPFAIFDTKELAEKK